MKSLRRVALLFAAAVGASTPANSQPSAQLRVGALNIEWLGSPDRRAGAAKGVAQKPAHIAAYVRASGVDVLALEEISDDDGVADRRTNGTLDKAFAELNADGQAKWKYRLFPKHNEAEEQTWQLTGLAWNESRLAPVKSANGNAEEYRLELVVPAGVTVGAAGKPAFERWATAMKFSAGSGKTDIVVIPVHLKSNRAAFPGQNTAKQREVEAGMLLTALAEVRARFGDDDIIVLGDTNVLKKEEKAVAAFRAAGFVDLNAADSPTYISGSFKSPFDRAFVPKADGNPKAKEFAQPSFDVFTHPTFSSAQYRRRVSDHRMIRLRIEVMTDDD